MPASPPLRHDFVDARTPEPQDLPAEEYNLNATRTDLALTTAEEGVAAAATAQAAATAAAEAAAEAQADADAAASAASAANANKVDKATGNARVYIRNVSGNEGTAGYTSLPTVNTFPVRDAAGTFEVSAPTSANHPARKTEVDAKLATVNSRTLAQAGKNWILDAAFADTWIWGGDARVTLSATYKLGGFNSMRFVADATSNGIQVSRIVDGAAAVHNVRPGDVLEFGGSLYLPATIAAGTVYFYLRFTDSTGVNANAFANTNTVTLSGTGAGAWVPLTGIARVPAGYDRVTLAIAPTSLPVGAIVHFGSPYLRDAVQPRMLTGTTATAINTSAKTVTLDAPNATYVPVAGDELRLTYTNGNNASSLTLAINGGSALSINSPGSTNTAIDHVIAAGRSARYYFDGTRWNTYNTALSVSEITDAEIIDPTSTGFRYISGRRMATALATVAKPIVKFAYTGGASTVLYYEIGRLPIDNSGNAASVNLSGRLGGWPPTEFCTWQISLANRTSTYTGDTITATVVAQGSPTGALTKGDIEVYAQADKSAIIYLKATSYYAMDLRGSGAGYGATVGTVGLVDTPVTPTGTKVWALSTAPRLEVGADGKTPVTTLRATGTRDGTTVLHGDGTWKTAASAASNNYLVWAGDLETGIGTWPTRPANALPTVWVGGIAPDTPPPEWESGDFWQPAVGDHYADFGAVIEALQTLSLAGNKIPYFASGSSAGVLDLKTSIAATPSDTAVPSEAAIKNYVDRLVTQAAKTGAYNVIGTDQGTVIEYNSTSNGTFTITNDFAAGNVVGFRSINTGILTIAAGSGVTLNSYNSAFKLAGQWAEASLNFRTNTHAILSGQLVA